MEDRFDHWVGWPLLATAGYKLADSVSVVSLTICIKGLWIWTSEGTQSHFNQAEAWRTEKLVWALDVLCLLFICLDFVFLLTTLSLPPLNLILGFFLSVFFLI